MPAPVFLYRSGIEADELTVTTPDFEALDRLGPTDDVQPVAGRCRLILEDPGPSQEEYAELSKWLETPPTPCARRFVFFNSKGEGYDLWIGCDEDGRLEEAEGYEPNNFIPFDAELGGSIAP